jgi:hypothetical protein
MIQVIFLLKQFIRSAGIDFSRRVAKYAVGHKTPRNRTISLLLNPAEKPVPTGDIPPNWIVKALRKNQNIKL